MERKQHFVLIHNAFHGAWIWYKLKPLLESVGHQVTAIDLAASGIDPRPIQAVESFAEYSQPLIKTLESLPENEKVILVGFSLGAINIALAADMFPEKIKVLVFIDAFMPDTTHVPSYILDKYMEISGGLGDSELSTHGTSNGTIMSLVKMGPNFLKTRLYQNCPLEDYELVLMLNRQGSFFQEDLSKQKKFTEEGYGSVPRVFVKASEDKAIPSDFTRWMIDNFKVAKVYEIDGGDHMVMLSKPKELFHSLSAIAADY